MEAFAGGRVMGGGEAFAITAFSSGEGWAGRCGRSDTGGLGVVAFAASTRSFSVGSAEDEAVGSSSLTVTVVSSSSTCDAAA